MKNNSFDLLRILAASLVLVSHSFALTGQPEPILLFGLTLGGGSVAVFFVVSGYLVFQSISRDPNFFRFIARRALRIFPGLAAMLLFTIVLIGPINTILSLQDYFLNSETWRYLNKIKLWGDDYLPGVFVHNSYPTTVNGSLWTLKFEFVLYILMGGLVFFKRKIWHKILLTTLFLFAITSIILDSRCDSCTLPGMPQLATSQNIFPLGCFFILGAVISVYKDIFNKLTPNQILLLLCFASLAPLLKIYWITILASYLFVGVAAIKFGESTISSYLHLFIRNDISYGLYIYAFPVQQSVSAKWPNIDWVSSIIVSAPFVVGLSYVSWIFIEKSTLALKKKL